jgi:hypothetical protein
MLESELFPTSMAESFETAIELSFMPTCRLSSQIFTPKAIFHRNLPTLVH